VVNQNVTVKRPKKEFAYDTLEPKPVIDLMKKSIKEKILRTEIVM